MNTNFRPNVCVFSDDRQYRYTLDHDERDSFSTPYVAWIGLNPSIADERNLDRTLNKVLQFTRKRGFHRFVMVNLFAFVSPLPKVMRNNTEPIGEENDRHILEICGGATDIICCWGNDGDHRGRAEQVLQLLTRFDLYCLGRTATGQPRHPLYLSVEKTAFEVYRSSSVGYGADRAGRHAVILT